MVRRVSVSFFLVLFCIILGGVGCGQVVESDPTESLSSQGDQLTEVFDRSGTKVGNTGNGRPSVTLEASIEKNTLFCDVLTKSNQFQILVRAEYLTVSPEPSFWSLLAQKMGLSLAVDVSHFPVGTRFRCLAFWQQEDGTLVSLGSAMAGVLNGKLGDPKTPGTGTNDAVD